MDNSLIDWPVHQPAEVVAVDGSDSLVRRLEEQGIHVGGQVEVVGRAPFLGPILVRAKGAVVAMRRGEAKCVMVRPSNP
jgi:ferrous iron transport protein A